MSNFLESGDNAKYNSEIKESFELFVKVKLEFAKVELLIVLLQLEQPEGFVTVHEYATGTEVVPQVGKIELLERVRDAGEHTEVLLGTAIELVGGLMTQTVFTKESGPQLFD